MGLNTKETEQISFDDIEFEAEYTEEENEKYYTISGKELSYNPEYEKYGLNSMDIEDDFEGRPEISIFENEDKSYDALRLRLIDDGAEQIMDLYVNYPKKDYPYVKGINKSFDFYRTCFDFIYSVLRHNNEQNVVDENGEEYNRFKKVNIETLAKYVDQHEYVRVRVIEGNSSSDYNSWIIYKME